MTIAELISDIRWQGVDIETDDIYDMAMDGDTAYILYPYGSIANMIVWGSEPRDIQIRMLAADDQDMDIDVVRAKYGI